MLRLIVRGPEMFDDSKQEFITQDDVVLELEHSLASLSKWECFFEKPFLSTVEKTSEEVIMYIKMMTLTPEVPEEVFARLSDENYNDVNTYLNAKMTATWFHEEKSPPSREVVTSELVYYWMTVLNIPFECDQWHLNRLFTLIRICNIKQSKPKKMSRSEAAAWQREQNAIRRAASGSKG